MNNNEITFGKAFKYGAMGIALIGGLTLVGNVVGVFTETAAVANEQFGPRAMLAKYEWFKNASAKLDEQSANLLAYRAKIDAFKSDYEGIKKSEWPRDERQAFNQLRAEYQGMLQMYNSVASDYNAQSSKFNWSSFDTTDGDQIQKQYNIIK